MIDIFVDTGAICLKVNRYIQRHMLAYGCCSVEDVAHLNGVRSVQVSEIGWPLRRVGWVEMPKMTCCIDSDKDCWKIQLDDPVLLDSFTTFKTECHNGKTATCFTVDEIRNGKIYDVKTIHKEDMVDAMRYSDWLTQEMANVFKNVEKETFRKQFEYPLTPKSIEQSADHKTVCVLWQDNTKTIVELSENDRDDIDTAFAYALAKKIFGTNTHLKKVVRQKLNEHKPRKKDKNG